MTTSPFVTSITTSPYSFEPCDITSSSSLTATKISASQVVVGDIDLQTVLTTLMDRLAILAVDPAKLEKFAALKEAYNHYKTIEALCNDK